MVIPIERLPWTTYLTLTNPGNQAMAGKLVLEGRAAEFSANEETQDITIRLLDSKQESPPSEFNCSIDPGTYRLIHLDSPADLKTAGEIRIRWQDKQAASDATVTLEAPESGVGGAIIQAGEYRVNPFYGVPVFLQYVGPVDAEKSPPLRFVCSQTSRVEIYQLDGSPLAIDGQGNGSLLNQGDELFTQSDGSGNLVLPLSRGNAAMNLMIYPDKAIPQEGLTIDIEAFTDGAWQLHSRNKLAR